MDRQRLATALYQLGIAADRNAWGQSYHTPLPSERSVTLTLAIYDKSIQHYAAVANGAQLGSEARTFWAKARADAYTANRADALFGGRFPRLISCLDEVIATLES